MLSRAWAVAVLACGLSGCGSSPDRIETTRATLSSEPPEVVPSGSGEVITEEPEVTQLDAPALCAALAEASEQLQLHADVVAARSCIWSGRQFRAVVDAVDDMQRAIDVFQLEGDPIEAPPGLGVTAIIRRSADGLLTLGVFYRRSLLTIEAGHRDVASEDLLAVGHDLVS